MSKLKPHLSEKEYSSCLELVGDEFFDKNNIGIKAKIEDFEENGIKFESQECHSSGALTKNQRNFVIPKKNWFRILSVDGKIISGIEFQDDVHSKVEITNVGKYSTYVSSKYESTSNGKDYYMLHNFDNPQTKLEFIVDADEDFDFEDLILYIK